MASDDLSNRPNSSCAWPTCSVQLGPLALAVAPFCDMCWDTALRVVGAYLRMADQDPEKSAGTTLLDALREATST